MLLGVGWDAPPISVTKLNVFPVYRERSKFNIHPDSHKIMVMVQ